MAKLEFNRWKANGNKFEGHVLVRAQEIVTNINNGWSDLYSMQHIVTLLKDYQEELRKSDPRRYKYAHDVKVFAWDPKDPREGNETIINIGDRGDNPTATIQLIEK